MSAEIIKKTDTQATFLIKVAENELKHAKEASFDHLRPRVKASGFRPGKAPDNIVERELGSQMVQGEVIEHAMQHAYSDAVRDSDITVIAPPEINLKKFVPYTELEFEATVEIMPPIKLTNYKKIKKKAKPVLVDEKKVDEVVDDLRRRVAKRIPVTRGAEMGDEVKFDFEGKRDGEPFAGGASKNHTLKLGSGQFIPGFEEQMLGLKPGDEQQLMLTFPEDYHETELAGQPVTFDVKVHEVTELVLPELDDKLASEVGPFKTVAELRADVRDQLSSEAEEEAKRAYENELLEEIANKSKLTAPDRLVAQQLERLKVELSQRLAASGLDMDKYLQMQNKTQDEMEKELRPEAERRVKLAMILSEVAREEDIKVSPEEVEAEVESLRQRYTDPTMQEELASDQIREDVFNHLLAGRTVGKLIEYAQQ